MCWDILLGTCSASYGFIFFRVVGSSCHQADQSVSLVAFTLNLPFTKINLVFHWNYVGTMHLAPQKTMEPPNRMLHPRRVGDTVPKLDYTNVYRTHSSHLSANGDVDSCACHANIAPATKQTILYDVAESHEKEHEGRMNAGPAARSKGSFQRKVGCSKRSLLALPACSIGRYLFFVTRSFR